MADFMQSMQAAQAAQDAYVATLPEWVRMWMYWMLGVLGIGGLVAAIFKVEARWALLAFVLALPATMFIGMNFGWNKLWGAAHLVFWTPAAIYMIRRWPAIDKMSIYGVWYAAALGTMLISLAFDAKDVTEYFLGV